MLGKLIKHDFKATARLFIPITLGFIGMSIINKLSFELGLMNNINNDFIEIISGLFMTFYIISAIALAMVTQIFIAMHFYKSMTGNQGYLSHTLPVKASALISSKLLVSIIWQCISAIVIVFSIILLCAGHVTGDEIEYVWSMFVYQAKEFNISISLIIFQIFFFSFIGIIYSTLMYYVSMAIGHLYHKHRLGSSIVAYFVIYFMISIASSIIGMLFSSDIFYSSDIIYTSYNFQLFWNKFNLLMISTAIYSILLCAVFYGITHYIFNKKLNME